MAKKTLGFIELNWTCPNCGTVNPGSNRACSACGNPQPLNVQFEQQKNQQLIEDQEKIVQAKKGADVHCPYCGTRNSADSEECLRCGGDLSDGTRRVAGRILGTHQPAEDDAEDMQCPSCGQSNNSNAQFCVHCGTPLKSQTAPTSTGAVSQQTVAPIQKPAAQTKPTSRKKMPVWIILVILLLSAACVIGLIALLAGGGSNEPVDATVTETYWEYSFEVEELQYITRENWESDIPYDATILSCNQKLKSIESEPVSGSVEVCGEPYSVDLGNGYAELTQDCEYEVYADFCSYETLDWVTADTLSTSGFDLYPYWPEFTPDDTQQIGARQEEYLVTFQGEGETYQYAPPDLSSFQQCDLGTTWELEFTIFGNVKNISRVK